MLVTILWCGATLAISVVSLFAFALTLRWLRRRYEVGTAYYPLLFEPLTRAEMPRRTIRHFARVGPEFVASGFVCRGEFLLQRTPQFSVARLWQSADGKDVGVVLDYRGVRTFECISLLDDGTYVESVGTRQKLPDSHDPKLQLEARRRRSVAELWSAHRQRRMALESECRCQTISLDAADLPRVLDYGHRLMRRELFAAGMIPAPPPLARDWPGPTPAWASCTQLPALTPPAERPVSTGGLAVWAAAAIVLVALVEFAVGGWTRSWPETTGLVEHSRLRESNVKGGWSYRAEVNYRYSVDGVEYRSTNWRIGDDGPLSASDARQIVDAYPPGKLLPLYVCPWWAGWSVAEPGPGPSAARFLGLGAVIAATATAIGRLRPLAKRRWASLLAPTAVTPAGRQ